MISLWTRERKDYLAHKSVRGYDKWTIQGLSKFLLWGQSSFIVEFFYFLCVCMHVWCVCVLGWGDSKKIQQQNMIFGLELGDLFTVQMGIRRICSGDHLSTIPYFSSSLRNFLIVSVWGGVNVISTKAGKSYYACRMWSKPGKSQIRHFSYLTVRMNVITLHEEIYTDL